MPRLPLLVLLLLLAGGEAAAQAPAARLDPALRQALRLADRGGAAPAAGLPSPGLEPGPDGRPSVRLLARIAPGGEDALRRAGAVLGARAGDVVAARVPLDALARLAADPAVLYLEAARTLAPGVSPLPAAAPAAVPAAGDLATADIGADRLRERVGERFYGLAGQGVIIGVYDSGLDLAHGDFLDPDGRTRVLFAWDQTTAGRPPGTVGQESFDYGLECRASEIDAGACPLTDRVGHGTHVAGIAAGDGSATGHGLPAFRYAGVAPAADLIVVKGGDASFSTDLLLDGVAYVFARAAELGRPAVVNLSLATPSGPHDGTTNFERALDALAGPGRIIVGIAGNYGSNRNESPAFPRSDTHAGGTLAAGGSIAHALVVPAYQPRAGAINDGAVLELWYDGRDSLTVTVTTPAGQVVRAETGDTAVAFTPSGAVFIDNAYGGPEAINGDHAAMITLVDYDAGAPPAAGRWLLTVEAASVGGPGSYHLWLTGSNLQTANQLATLEGGTSNRYLVGVPGTAGRVLTAAAHVTRAEWKTVGGEPRSYPFQEPIGDIAHFSAPGPRRDGVRKPDLSAPGKLVIAARAADGSIWRDIPWLVEEDAVHGALLGTSMAAPQLAGAASLLLQLRPGLGPEELRELLAAAARADAFARHPYTGEPDGLPNDQWGAGKLDVGAAARLLGLPPGTLTLEVAPLPDPGVASSARGTRLPLLRLHAAADSVETIGIQRLAFDLEGQDPAARALLVADEDRDGAIGPADPVVAAVDVPLDGSTRAVFEPGPSVPPGFARDFLLALELGGGAPNAMRFAATYLPAETRTLGSLSGARDRVAGPGAPVASGDRRTTLLAAGERVNLSANPVRGDRLVVNFAERPRAVAVYALSGERVRRLAGADLDEGRAVWRLDNDAGGTVAPGVYLLVVEFENGREVRKVIIGR